MTRPLAAILVVLALAGCRAPEPASSASPAPTAVSSPTPGPAPSPTPEPVPDKVRAVWVHLFDDTLKTRAGIEGMLERLDETNANTVIAQVARRHDAYYSSDVLPRTADPALETGLDVLAELVRGARTRGLDVHAWISAAPTYHRTYDELPRPPGWVWSDHGPQAPEAQRWVSRDASGRWGEYLDPSLPEVRQHVAAVAGELAARYEIDAVHLDYVRYDGVQWGYHPRVLDRYRSETGATGTPDPEVARWSDWRRGQTRAVIEAARQAITASGRRVGLSAAVIAQGDIDSDFRTTIAYRDKLQNWPAWLEEGLLDIAFPMAYFRDSAHAGSFDRWTAFAGGNAGQVAIGVGAFLNPVEASVRQVELAMGSTDGVAVYSYQQNAASSPHDALLTSLGTGAWATPVTPSTATSAS